MSNPHQPDQPTTIATFVREARQALGLTQDSMAAMYNCTKGNISAWENGRHVPSYAILVDLSNQSGVRLPIAESSPIPHQSAPQISPRATKPPNDDSSLLEIALEIIDGTVQNDAAIQLGRKKHKLTMIVVELLKLQISQEDINRLMPELIQIAAAPVEISKEETELLLGFRRSAPQMQKLLLTFSKRYETG